MMFWLIVLAVVGAVLFGLAWWSSGRSKGAVPPGPGPDPGIDTDSGWTAHQHNIRRSTDGGGLGPL